MYFRLKRWSSYDLIVFEISLTFLDGPSELSKGKAAVNTDERKRRSEELARYKFFLLYI